MASEERGEGRAGEAVARLGRQRPLKKGARDAAAMGAGAEKAAAGPESNSWAEEAVAELKRQQPLDVRSMTAFRHCLLSGAR